MPEQPKKKPTLLLMFDLNCSRIPPFSPKAKPSEGRSTALPGSIAD